MSMNLDQTVDKITPSSGTLNIAGAILPTTALAVGGGGTGVTTSTGSGANVLGTSPTITNPALGGATSGSVTLAVPAVAGSNTATLPAATGTVMVSGNMPAFSAYRDSAQSLSTSTATKITFVGKFFDTNSNFASDTFTPTVAGYYQINFTLAFTGSNAAGLCYSAIFKNGSQWIQSGRLPCNVSLGNPTISVSDLIYCNGSTDYIEFYGFQNSGSSSNIGDKTIASGCLVRTA